jgi:tyrosine-protein kinase Etk/Wzc
MGQISSLSDVLGLLRRRAWLIVLILMFGVPAAMLYALSRPQLYEATAVIQIEAPQVAATATALPAPTFQADTQLDLIQQKLMSRDVLNGIIAKFSIYPADVPLIQQVALLRGAVTITKLVDPAQAFQPNVQPSGLSITVRLGDAQQAADVANEFLADILAEAQSRAEGRATRTLEFFEAEEARVGAEIAARDAEFARFKEANGDSLPDGLNSQREQQSRLVESRIVLDQQIIGLQTASDRFREEEVARQKQLLEQQRDLIDENIATIQAALDAAPEVQRQFNAFDRQLAQLQEEFRAITARRTEAAMNQLLETQDQAARFEVLETAIVPEYSVSASRKKVAMAGVAFSGLVAIGLAFALEMLNSAVRTAAQLERQLGIQPVIVIPYLNTRQSLRNRRMRWLISIVALVVATLLIMTQQFGFVFRSLPGQQPVTEPEQLPDTQ